MHACVDAEQTLDNIIICRVFSHEEQMGELLTAQLHVACIYSPIDCPSDATIYSFLEIVKPIAALLADAEQGPFRLLIIDSIIALFRVEFSGRGELSERQQKLGQHLSVSHRRIALYRSIRKTRL